MDNIVKLKALDSFHHSPLGMVPAKAEFEASASDALQMIELGLAEQVPELVPQVLSAKPRAKPTR